MRYADYSSFKLVELPVNNKSFELSLVVPFYNEEENITNVVNGLRTTCEKALVNYELVLVNNGSTDNSASILEDLAKKEPNKIKVFKIPVNQGYGWGIINGLKNASGEYVGFMSGDGQTKPEDLLRVFRGISEDCKIVKAKRTVRNDGIARKVLSKACNLLFLALFNVKTSDVNGSPKILKNELLRKIAPTSKDWFIDAEIVIKAKYLNLKIKELPVEFLRREKGKSHVSFSTIFEFARNILNYRFGGGLREWKQAVQR